MMSVSRSQTATFEQRIFFYLVFGVLLATIFFTIAYVIAIVIYAAKRL